MNYKTCQKLQESFEMNNKAELFLITRDNSGAVKKRTPLEDSLLKGYVYACLYFYDEVQKEVDKLQAMIFKIINEVKAEVQTEEEKPELMLMELSTRVRKAIGDDSLEALIKNILAERAKHISLMADEKEKEKFLQVKEAIFLELFTNFFNMTFNNTHEAAGKKAFQLAQDYVDKMTERQKKLLAPALKMTGFIHQLKLNQFELMSDWTVRYIPERMPESFDATEEGIKTNIKKLMEKQEV